MKSHMSQSALANSRKVVSSGTTAAMSVQSDIAALGTALALNREYLVRRHEHRNNRMFSGPVKRLLDEGRLAKICILE